MFGKNAISEDEDWGPCRRKLRGNDSNAENTFIPSSENQCNSTEEGTVEVKKKLLSRRSKRPIFRFPRNVVEVRLDSIY